MKTFILSHNPFEPSITSAQIQAIVRNNRFVSQWYFPFTGTCIFKSESELSVLAPSFRELFNHMPFFLSEVFPPSMGGSQDQYVWDWLNTNKMPTLPSPT